MKNRPLYQPDEQGHPPPHADPVALLLWTIQNRPGEVTLVNFAGSARRSRVVKAPYPRKAGTPRKDVGLVLVETPPYVVHNLQGPASETDFYVLLHFKREAVDAFDEEKTRRIILPGREM